MTTYARAPDIIYNNKIALNPSAIIVELQSSQHSPSKKCAKINANARAIGMSCLRGAFASGNGVPIHLPEKKKSSALSKSGRSVAAVSIHELTSEWICE